MDLTAQIIEAITGWLKDAAAQLLQPALSALGQLLFQTPALDTLPEVNQAWSLVRATTDGLLVLALVFAGIMVMASGAIESRYTAKVLVPRVVLAAVAVNASLALCGALIRLNNALVSSALGSDPGTAVLGEFSSIALSGEPGPQLAAIFIALASALLSLVLVALYIGRDLVLLVLTVLAPLALATYALPQTDEIARVWGRVFTALLFVQVAQAVLIGVAAQLLRNTGWLGGPISGLTSGLVVVTLLYVLFKLPFVAYQWALRSPFSESPPVRTVLLAARSIVAVTA